MLYLPSSAASWAHLITWHIPGGCRREFMVHQFIWAVAVQWLLYWLMIALPRKQLSYSVWAVILIHGALD
jgi:hypothetical protein